MIAEPEDGPPYYPHGGTYADLLCWHLYYWGTRAEGNTLINGRPWHEKEFRQKAFGDDWHKHTNFVGMQNWCGAGSAPIPATAGLIEKALLGPEGQNPAFAEWREDLRRFHEKSRGKGNNRRTRQFPDPPPPPEGILGANMPDVGGFFMCRDDEVAAILALFAPAPEGSAIRVEGGPGMGKTELTKAVAHHADMVKRFEERRWFASLETANSADQMRDAIILAIGGDPKSGLVAAFRNVRGKQSLLVLDNLETPWEQSAERAATEELLSALRNIAGLSILASFRGIKEVEDQDWKTFEVLPFLPPQAGRLFAAIAGPWVSDDNRLDEFLVALGGIPLAIDLVARRATGRRSLAPLWREWVKIGADFAKRPGQADNRLSSLPQSIELSLRSPRIKENVAARRFFGVLGHLPGGIAASDREALIGDESFEAEECLLSAGLAVERADRVHLLPPIRDYARRHYGQAGIDATAWADHFFQLAERWGDEIGGHSDDGILRRIVIEFPNIEAAIGNFLDRGDYELILPITNQLFNICQSGCLKTSVFHRLLEVCGDHRSEEGVANALWLQGGIAYSMPDLTMASSYYYQAFEIFRRLENYVGMIACITRFGDIAMQQRKYDMAKEAHQIVLALSEEIDENTAKSYSLMCLADISFHCGDNDEARKLISRALDACELSGGRLAKAECLIRLGNVEIGGRNFSDAETAFKLSLSISEKIYHKTTEAYALFGLGDVSFHLGAISDAMKFYENSLDTFRSVRHFRGQAGCHFRLATIATNQSELAAARDSYSTARSLYRRAEDPLNEAMCGRGIGDVCLKQADYPGALNAYLEARSLFQNIDDLSGVAHCNWNMGNVAAKSGEHARSLLYFEAARASFMEQEDWISVGNCLLSLGEVHLALADPKTAHMLLENSAAVFTAVGDDLGAKKANSVLNHLPDGQ